MKLTVTEDFSRDAHVIEAPLDEGVNARLVVGNDYLQRAGSIAVSVARVVHTVEQHNAGKAALKREADRKQAEQERAHPPRWRRIYEQARHDYHTGHPCIPKVWDFIGGSAHGMRYAVQRSGTMYINVAPSVPVWHTNAAEPDAWLSVQKEAYLPCVNVVLGTYAMLHEAYAKRLEGEIIQPDGSNAWRVL